MGSRKVWVCSTSADNGENGVYLVDNGEYRQVASAWYLRRVRGVSIFDVVFWSQARVIKLIASMQYEEGASNAACSLVMLLALVVALLILAGGLHLDIQIGWLFRVMGL